MLNEIKRLFNGQLSESMPGLMTEEHLYNYHQYEPEEVPKHSVLYGGHPPKTLSQQLIDDLAKLRENTTIIGRDPAEARYRLRRPFFEPGPLFLWPPIYPLAPLKDDFHADRCSEDSSSPSLSFSSEPSIDLESRNERVSTADSQVFLRGPTQYQVYSDSSPRLDYVSSVFNPKAPSPAPRIIPHIIGEDDPFNSFSYDLISEDKNARSIDSPKGRIFAPVPKLSTVAALANFEVLALTAMMPAVEGVVDKELIPSKDGNNFSCDWTSRSVSYSRKGAASSQENCPASPIHRPNPKHGDVLYQTSPKPQVQLVDDLIALVSLKTGPRKDEMMKQFWKSNDQGTSGSFSEKPADEMTGKQVYESLVPVPPQPPTSYPTDKQQLSLLRILSKND